MKIIEYRMRDDIDIEFLDDFHYVKKHNTYSNFKSGSVKNPYDRTLFGVGYLGDGEYMARKNHKMEDSYEIWSKIIERCYWYPQKYPAYHGKCIVCDKWHNYQNFAKWFNENKYEVEGSLHIDKDILFPNSNIYSEETCLLVPQIINMMFMNKPNKRGLPNGIYKNRNGYLAEYGEQKLGVYPTLEEAYAIYAMAKEKKIKEVADEYKGIIPKKVYEALYDYKVDIRNDKNYKAV